SNTDSKSEKNRQFSGTKAGEEVGARSLPRETREMTRKTEEDQRPDVGGQRSDIGRQPPSPRLRRAKGVGDLNRGLPAFAEPPSQNRYGVPGATARRALIPQIL